MIFFVINYNLVKKKSNILALKNKHFPMIISYIELFILWKLILSQNGRGHLNLLIPMIKSKVSFGIGQKRVKKKKKKKKRASRNMHRLTTIRLYNATSHNIRRRANNRCKNTKLSYGNVLQHTIVLTWTHCHDFAR